MGEFICKNLDVSLKEAKYLQKKYFTRATFKYLDNEEKEANIVICKNQTCSDKMKTIEDIKKYLIKNF